MSWDLGIVLILVYLHILQSLLSGTNLTKKSKLQLLSMMRRSFYSEESIKKAEFIFNKLNVHDKWSQTYLIVYSGFC